MQAKQGAESGDKTPLFHTPDTVLAAIILAAAAALYYITTTFEDVPALLSQNIGPELFPQLVLIVIILLTLGLPIEHRFVRGGRARLDDGRLESVKAPTWLTAGLMTIIVALMPIVGTLVAMFLACFLMPMLWGNFRFRLIIPFAVIFPIAVKLVFADLLKVHFEPGLWERLLS